MKSSKYHKQYTYESNEEEEDIYGDGALVLLDGIKELLRNSSKKRYRKHQQNTDLSGDVERDIDGSEEKERYKREFQYIHNEQKHIQTVHKELCEINNKLQSENKRLNLWEAELNKRESHLDRVEKQLLGYAESMEDTIKHQVIKKTQHLEEEFELKKKDINLENKKLRCSLKALKKANETYKNMVELSETKIRMHEEKHSGFQNRISNFQRKIEILNQQLKEHEQDISPTSQKSKESVKNSNKNINTTKKSKEEGGLFLPFFDIFGTLLHWISDSQLKLNVSNLLKSNNLVSTATIEHDITTELTNEKCMKVMILLPTILTHASGSENRLQLSFVQFIYWSIFHAHLTQSSQKFSHSATYRRIGEELYQRKADKTNRGAFFKNDDVQIRLLSSLVILYSVTQADIISNAFQQLNSDLRQEQCKSHFITYRGSFVLLPFFKITNKVNLSNTIDVLMVMATESPFLQAFLDSISTVEWMQGILTIMGSCQEEIKTMEKLSLLLQRLSKSKSNKQILDALQVKSIVSEFARTCSPDEEFLQLNLRSILFNIESMKAHRSTVD